MDHERYKEWLHLSVFDELGENETSEFEAHVQSCGECRRERDELVKMLDAIEWSGAGEPSEAALSNARQRLSAALRQEAPADHAAARPAKRAPILARLFGIAGSKTARAAQGGWFQGPRLGLAGAATLVVGFLMGYLAFGIDGPAPPVTQVPRGPQTEPPANGTNWGISNVHFLDADAADGEVELLYDQVRPARLKARMDDRRVRKLLAHAILNGENPGVRLEAINVLETSENTAPAGEVKQAILDALISDPNAGVRRQALLVLQKMPFDDDIKRAMLFALSYDDNPGLRVAAMNYLAAYTVDGVIPEQEFEDILDAGRPAGKNRPDGNRPNTH